jgi:tetratricopeptide (TPR) repeat protein
VRAIAAGNLDDVAVTLRQVPEGDEWARHYAAFASLRGAVDDELMRLTSANFDDAAGAARRRLALWRASGDLTAASRDAQQLSPELYLRLLLERHDWQAAAQHLTARIDADPRGAGSDVEQLGLAVACHRLAGHLDQAERYAELLMMLGKEVSGQLRQLKPDQQKLQSQRRELITRQWHIAKALLLSGFGDEAMWLIRKDQPSFVFELLCEQLRYREAFDVAGVPYPDGFDDAWFRKIAADSANATDALEHGFTIAQLAIRNLHFLGRREDAKRCHELLVAAARNDRATRRLRMLCETAVKLAWREPALDLAALVIQLEERPDVLAVLHPVRTGTANVWWEYFREAHGAEPLIVSLGRVDEMLQPRPSPDRLETLQQKIRAVAARIPSLPAARQTDWWHELGETCTLHGQRERAIAYYTQAATKSVPDALKLGDLAAAERTWDQAASWYEKAWQLDQSKSLPLYLSGRALQQTDRSDAGKRMVELAELMPLAIEQFRQELAMGLKERGYRDEARRHFELLLRTGEPQSGRWVDAAKQLGNLTYLRDELQAADCWQSMVLSCLKPSWGFVERPGYVQIPFLIHKTRAKGLIKAGEIADALREVECSIQFLPANTELAEELVPLYAEAHQQAAADDLLVRCTLRLRNVLDDFSTCATLHNNLAWLLARCDRELDDALEHAQQALQLAPYKPSFVDTLGEVYFRRGQLDKALDCAQSCVEAEPSNAHYRAQLERFRSAIAAREPTDAQQ